MTIVAAVALLSLIGLIIGAALGWAGEQGSGTQGSGAARVTDAIDALLPQTQCAQCGYPGCRPYAVAIAAGEAINRCPPGGDSTVADLARLLGRPATPLAQDLEPTAPTQQIAFIDEDRCIGCALCLPACPVDAIVGANRFIHTVIRGHCTGCELCIPACPVDCIDLVTDDPIRPLKWLVQ